MSLTIELSKDVEAALASQASAAQVPTERYVAEIIEEALKRRERNAVKDLQAHLDDMAASVALGTTREEMECALEEALLAVRPQRNWQQ